jgi:hypothetical protein
MTNKLNLMAAAWGLTVLLPAQADAQLQTRRGFEIGTELFDYEYRERSEGQVIASDTGSFPGITASFVAGLGKGYLFRTRFSADFGSVNYSSDDGDIEDIRQSIGQLEFLVARDVQVSQGSTITPFIGLGSRILNDRSGGRETESGLLGYDREISYAYVPVGAAVATRLGGSSTLTFNAQYNWVVGGDAESKFSRIDPEFPDVKLEIPGGRGLEASVIVGVPLGRRQIRFGPFVRHWKIRQSEGQLFENEDGSFDELVEPKNKTNEFGVRLSVAF